MNGSIIGPRTTTSYSSAYGIWGIDELLPKLYSTGKWPGYSGLVLNYSFSSGTANLTATFAGFTATLQGSPGVSGDSGSAGGTYNVTSNVTIVGFNSGGAKGGDGGTKTNAQASGGGAIGNARGQDTNGSLGFGSATAANNVGGILDFATAAGYNSSTFGRGGPGGNNNDGSFPGGAPGGTDVGGVPAYGGAGVFIQYISSGITYRQTATTNGSLTLPAQTTYVKLWAVGAGGQNTFSTRIGAGAGGLAWGEFT
jgi:hypothetical protein